MSIPIREREWNTNNLVTRSQDSDNLGLWGITNGNAWVPNPSESRGHWSWSHDMRVRCVEIRNDISNFSKIKIQISSIASASIDADFYLLDTLCAPNEVSIDKSIAYTHIDASNVYNLDVVFDGLDCKKNVTYYFIFKKIRNVSTGVFTVSSIVFTEEAPIEITANKQRIIAQENDAVTFSVENLGDASYDAQLSYSDTIDSGLGDEHRSFVFYEAASSTDASIAITCSVDWIHTIDLYEVSEYTLHLQINDTYGRQANYAIILASYPEFITQPESNITVGNDEEIELSVQAIRGKSSSITYQWQWSRDGSKWNNANSATSRTYTFDSSYSYNGYQFRCKATNDIGSSYSDVSHLTVTMSKPIITSQPKNQIIKTGSNATFSVIVSAEYPVYQWQVSSDDGATWADISENADDAFYLFKAEKIDSEKKYRCKIKNSFDTVSSEDVFSEDALLTVLDPPIITNDLVILATENESSVDLSITATGDMLQYQWESSSDNRSTWVAIANDSDIPSTYSFTATENQNGKYYRCIVSNPVGSVSSSEQELTVVTLPSIVTQPKSVSIGRGEVATFQVAVSGDVSGYQWQVYTSETPTWTNVPENGNTAVYSVTADIAMSGNRYRCWISNPLNSSKIKTNTVTLAVFNPIVIISPSSDYVVNANIDEQATFSVEATGDDLRYQWQYYYRSTEKWRNGSGATDTSYTTTATEARNGRQYRCKVFNDYLTVYSPVARLNVIIPPPPIITTEPASISVGLNKPATFSVVVSNPPVTYQWQVSTTNGGTWTNVSDGGTEASYRIDEVSSEMDNYQYRCILTNTRGETTSNAAVLSIIPVPVIVRQPVSVSATVGSTVTFSVQANGEQLKYQWQYSKNGGGTWKNAPSSNASAKTNAWTLTVSATYDSYRFRCVVSNPSSTGIASEAASITISAPPEITKDISSVTVNEGDSVTFSINATGGDLNYQWQVSINNGRDWINVANNGNTSAYSVTANANQNQNQFRCKVWNALGEVYSNNAIVSVRSNPQITVQPRPVTAVYGVLATFVVVAEGGELTYQWQQSLDDGETWKNIKGYTKPTLSVTATEARNGRQFRCVVTNEAGSTTSDAALFTTFESSGYEDDNSGDQEQYTDRYLPSEMADMIRKIKGGGTNLDEIQFGEMTEEDLYSISTNPGSTDPKYYEEIAEAINDLIADPQEEYEKTFAVRTIREPGVYYAKDDGVDAYSTIIVDIQNDTLDTLETKLIEGTLTELIDSFGMISSIANEAFNYLSGLETISFALCKTIGSSAFCDCRKLQTATFPVCTHIEQYAFARCFDLVSTEFPLCLSINDYAFMHCSSLSSVSFPMCSRIGMYAFSGCNQLIDINMPSCSVISDGAFSACSSLVSASFPKCKYVASNAFRDCISLQAISLPECSYIGMYAFLRCLSLKSVYLLGSSIPVLYNKDIFYSTPIDGYTAYTDDTFGSIYVPSSLYDAYCSANTWSLFSSRFVSI